MLWLALYCPTLALDGILRRWPADARSAVPALAVTDVDGSRRFVAAATEAAQASGVHAGQSLPTAMALLPDLVVVPRRIDDERSALADAALAALRFTPTVSVRASGLVMELSASLKLFGGWRALQRSIAATMHGQGLGIAAAEGPTPHGAWLLAKEKARVRPASRPQPGRPRRASHDDRDGDPRGDSRSDAHTAAASPSASPARARSFSVALDALPIGHLESLGAAIRRMAGIGCHTLADLRRLPAQGLARRFGEALTDELARASGERSDPQPLFEAPERFDGRIELMARVESAEALVFASERLVAQLGGWLAARRAAVRGFTLTLHHDRWTRDAIPPTAVPIALASPSSDPSRLVTLIRERFARLELKAPVVDLSLAAPIVVEAEESSGTLFPEREEATETLVRLLEKLTARLGPEAAARIERVADHRPERAWRALSGDALDASVARTAPVAGSSRVASGAGRSGVARIATAATGPVVTPARGDVAVRDDRTATKSSFPDAGAPRKGRASGAARTGSRARDAARLDRTDADIGVAHRPTMPGCACGPRPAWLLTTPRQLEVRSDRPIFESLPLDLMAGPERIETGWWDDQPATRDYFIAENASGHLVWIYRERLFEPDRPVWYLQGLFA